MTGFLISAIQSVLFFGVFWLALILFFRLIDDGGENLTSDVFYGSLPFSAFLLSWANIGLPIQALVFSFFCGTLIIIKLLDTPFLKIIKGPLYVLIFYLICFFVVLKPYSPLYHDTFYDTWGRNDFFVNLEHIWNNVKAYDFIGNFSQNGYMEMRPCANISYVLLMVTMYHFVNMICHPS